MSLLRRLDHVAVVVRNTDRALSSFRDQLGLAVAHSEELSAPRVRLTYLDCGNAYLQLVEPLDPEHELARWLEVNGEGLHHICFGVDNPFEAAAALASAGAPSPVKGSGRGRVSSFVPGDSLHGVRLECTEFRFDEDVTAVDGWLAE